jgi:hypothetical protein
LVAAVAEEFAVLAHGTRGKCELLGDARRSIPSLVAYSSSDERTLGGGERSSSIPASINGRRDINHIALIATIGPTRAVLWTRHRAEAGRTIRLTLHFDDESAGETTLAEVERVDDHPGDRPEMWPYEVIVRFAKPIDISRVEGSLPTQTD